MHKVLRKQPNFCHSLEIDGAEGVRMMMVVLDRWMVGTYIPKPRHNLLRIVPPGTMTAGGAVVSHVLLSLFGTW